MQPELSKPPNALKSPAGIASNYLGSTARLREEPGIKLKKKKKIKGSPQVSRSRKRSETLPCFHINSWKTVISLCSELCGKSWWT